MKRGEEQLQMACVRWFRYTYQELAGLLHHSPNGGLRTRAEAGKFKAMGTVAGFPDLFLCVPSGGYHGLFIEIKSATGRQTPNQREFEAAATLQGYAYCICREYDEFVHIVSRYLQDPKPYNKIQYEIRH